MVKIALIGAGAVGAYFIWGFHGNTDVDFHVIADGERYRKIKEQGVYINGQTYYPPVLTSREAGRQDIILVATKYSGLGDVIDILPLLVGHDTIVLSLLNGVDSEERIAKKVGWEHVDYAVMRIASRREQYGIVFQPEATQGLFVGMDKLTMEQLTALGSSKCNINTIPDIKTDLWVKYASNIANNLPQAVLMMNQSLLLESQHGRALAEHLWHEVEQVALAKGIVIGSEPIIFNTIGSIAKYSTLQDLEAKRHTEIDMFAGVLMEMAKEYDIAVPYTEFCYHAIKALEERNDGLIG